MSIDCYQADMVICLGCVIRFFIGGGVCMF